MRIDSALAPDFKPGTLIEAGGVVTFFPFRPGLNAIKLTELDQKPAPEPLALERGAVRAGIHRYNLCGYEANFDRCATTVLFEAKLPLKLFRELKLEPGMRLRLTGICELELDNAFGIARFTKVFTLTLRAAQDLVVLERPPYWNKGRLLGLLSVTGGAGLLFAALSWMLRRKVAEQSAIIERQTTTRATLDERQRIARDLHDTLEQELSSVAILLDTTSQQCAKVEVRLKRDPLTVRELEVLHLIVEGLINKEIGGRLGITEGTFKLHVAKVLAKVGAQDRTRAAILAVERGIVKL